MPATTKKPKRRFGVEWSGRISFRLYVLLDFTPGSGDDGRSFHELCHVVGVSGAPEAICFSTPICRA